MIQTNDRLLNLLFVFLSWNLFLESHIYATGNSVVWSDDIASTSNGDDTAQRSVIDSQGNIYVSGFSNGATLYGATNTGDYDVFTAKYANNGTLIWGRYIGTSAKDFSHTIALDSQENPVIAGFSLGSWANITNTGGYDVMVTKFNKDTGAVTWTRLLGGPKDDYCYGVTVDLSDDSIYAAGYTLNNLTNSSVNLGSDDAFILKLNTNGIIQWIKMFGTNESDRANGILIDPESHIFVVGSTEGVFDQQFGNRDGFLGKFDISGNQIWIRQFGSNDSDTFYSIDFDSTHSVIACGQVRGPFFGNRWYGQADVGCIEYDQGGTRVWATAVGGSGWDSAWTVEVNRTTTSLTPGSATYDSIFVAGYSGGAVYPYTTNGSNDILLFRLDPPNGKLLWVYMTGSPPDDQANGVVYDKTSGNLVATGYIGDNIPGVVNYTGAQKDGVILVIAPPFITDFDSQNSDGKDKNGGVNTAVVVGAVLGSVLGLILLLAIGGVVFLYMRKRTNIKMMEMFSSDDPTESNGALSSVSSLPSIGSTTSSQKKNPKDSAWEIDYAELILEKKIGQGASGIVYRAKWRKTEVAVKQLLINKASDKDIENFRAEAELMRNLRPNKNVLLYYGVCTDSRNPLCIVTEFLPNGNLWVLLQNSSFKWTNALKLKIIKGVASGMYHLAKEKIVHRDLAARNILLTENYEAKISDFGLSRVVENEDDSNQTSTNVGPIRWMSPEAIMQRIYSEKSDVWSFAVLVYEVLTQSQPYAGTTQIQVATQVGNKQLKLKYPQDIPVISPLLEKCMDWEPDNRPRFEDIMEALEQVTVNDQDQFVT